MSPLPTWYRATARDLPWRRPSFHDEFGAWGVLVSEFMLQQTPVTRVIPHPRGAVGALADALRDGHRIDSRRRAAVGEPGYPRRALWLHRAAVEITERHGGIVPRDVDALLALSGIGDYTARAVAVFAYGDRHPVVDTNTRRVLARAVEGSAAGTPSRRDLVLMADLLPDDVAEAAVFNAAAMELGATVCTSRAPRCELFLSPAAAHGWPPGDRTRVMSADARPHTRVSDRQPAVRC